MLIEEAVYSLLSTDAGVQAIVSDRVYPVTMPQFNASDPRTLYPAVIFDLGQRGRQYTHQGPTVLVESHLNVSCVSETYLGVKQLANAVRIALNGKAAELNALYTYADGPNGVQGIYLDGELDEYVFAEDEKLSLYHVPMDFMIQHKESLNG